VSKKNFEPQGHIEKPKMSIAALPKDSLIFNLNIPFLCAAQRSAPDALCPLWYKAFNAEQSKNKIF
jgi:hypothetical protein